MAFIFALMLVSVIIPCRNEELYIAKVIDNVFDQDYGKENLELLIAEGRSEDNTRAIIESYINKGYPITLIDNPDKVVSPGLNKCLAAAKGEWIVRLDAHSFYEKDYVSTLVREGIRLNAGNIGGVWITNPGRDTIRAKAIASATSHPIGIGNGSYRLGGTEIKQVDTVPFGCFPKAVLDEVGWFDEELTRNQDDELNLRIVQAGYKIYLVPTVEIQYFARSTFSTMCKMFYQYGLFKPLVNKKRKQPATWRQFVPPLFVLGILLGIIGSIFITGFYKLFTFGLLAYFLLLLFFAVKQSKGQKSKMVFIVNWITTVFLVHLSYGYGYWKGVFQFLIFNKTYSKTNTSR